MDFAIIQVASGGKKVVQLQNIFLSDDDNKYTIRGTKDLIKQADNGRSKTLRVSINKKLIACTVIEISGKFLFIFILTIHTFSSKLYNFNYNFFFIKFQ